MKHILELTAKYKIGHQHITTPHAIIGRNILAIERVPEEIPEHQDGVMTRVLTSSGFTGVTQPYDEVLKAWQESLEHEL